MFWVAKVSSKGQVTIPKPVRERLEIEPGTQVIFVARDDRVELEPMKESILSLRGIIPVDGPQDWGEVRRKTMEIIAAEIAAEGKG
jgi:AbrB family looped-hinge helix DNA binding protein